MTTWVPAIVFVEWMDSHGASEGWTEREESVDFGRRAISAPIISSGFLVHDDNDGIVVAVGYNKHADDVVGAMAIPRSAIVRLTQLRAEKGEAPA